MCGKLFCSQGQPDPNYGRMVSFGVCKATFFDDPTKDFGQVEAGTRCGEGKVGAGEPRPRHAPELTRVCVCEGVQPERVCGAADGLQEHQLLPQVFRPRGESRKTRTQTVPRCQRLRVCSGV